MSKYREEIAWAAGLFDGEGGIYVRKDGYGCQLRIGQKSEDENAPYVLTRFQKIVGRGKIYMVRKSSGYIIWTFCLFRFEDVQAVVAMLWVFLSPVKKAQAEVALKTILLR